MKKRFLLLSMLCFLLAIPFALHISAAETFVNPVVNGADPYVFKDGDTYYLYMTSGGSRGYRVYTSQNLVEWEIQGMALRREDVYTDQKSNPGVYNFWAPEIIKEGDLYYMIYSAQEHLGIATADSPLGPFKNDAKSFLFDFKAIDGHFFRDDDGKVYLYFVSCGQVDYNGYSAPVGNNIWGGEFDLATCTFVNGPKLLLTWAGDYYQNWHVVEGPEILKHNGTYYLTYSSSGYGNPGYSVCYATASSPLGSYTKYARNPILISDDVGYTDTNNPHLYGTAHHCFTVSPDGKDMIIVYHAHRRDNAARSSSLSDYVEERRICVDRAWFDDKGVLHAGSLKDGVPTAVAQPLPSGGTLTRKTHYEGAFVSLPTLPTVYVASKDGSDTNDGLTQKTAFKTLGRAYAELKQTGGTIVLTQSYACGDYFSAPETNGPVQIKGAYSAVPVTFKFLSFHSDTYLDNLALLPQTLNYISVIECNAHNFVVGDGVSCCALPSRPEFPILVGGSWRYTGSDSAAVYRNFKHASDAEVLSDADYTLSVYSGTWSVITEHSFRDRANVLQNKNAKLLLGDDVILRPGKVATPSAEVTLAGVKITFTALENVKCYAIYRNGKVIGYTDTTFYLDTEYTFGDRANYSVAAYENGACIGDRSTSVIVSSSSGLQDGLKNVLNTMQAIANGEKEASLSDVLKMLQQLIVELNF